MGQAACLQERSDSSTLPTPQIKTFAHSDTSDAERQWTSPSDPSESSAKDSSTDVTVQTSPESQRQEQPCGLSKLGQCLTDLAQDQAAIRTSAFRTKARDLKWVVPFAGITAGLIETDRISSHEATRGTHVNSSKTFSDAGLALAGGSTAGLYLLGLTNGNRQMRETGVLGGEAMLKWPCRG